MNKKHVAIIVSVLLAGSLVFVGFYYYTRAPTKPVEGFVTVVGNKFALNGETFYFNGTNQYYLFYKSHKMIDEVIEDAAAMGLTVIRTWGFCDGQWKDNFCFQPEPRVYDEPTFQQMDYIIYKAQQHGIRLILPLVNNWDDMGGMNQYVQWAHPELTTWVQLSHDNFYTDPECRSIFKDYINYFLKRVNTYTGVAYKDDPTIMMWELANEPRATSDPTGAKLQSWINEMAGYIKSIDPNHLVSTGEEGFYSGGNGWMGSGWMGSQGTNYIADHQSPYIDACSFHLYPDHWNISQEQSLEWIERHVRDAHEIVGKPAYMGEFGWQGKSTRDQVFTDWYHKIDMVDADGAMFWLLSGHQDDGTLYPDYDGFTVYYPENASTCAIIENYSNVVQAKSGQEIAGLGLVSGGGAGISTTTIAIAVAVTMRRRRMDNLAAPRSEPKGGR
jgi:mannan endo-1,4-beta-mannosidase